MCVGVGEGGAGGVLRWCSLRSLPSPPPRIFSAIGRVCTATIESANNPLHFQPHRRTPSPKRCQELPPRPRPTRRSCRAPEAEPLYVALHRLPCSENSRGKTKQISLSRVPLRGLDVPLTHSNNLAASANLAAWRVPRRRSSSTIAATARAADPLGRLLSTPPPPTGQLREGSSTVHGARLAASVPRLRLRRRPRLRASEGHAYRKRLGSD